MVIGASDACVCKEKTKPKRRHPCKQCPACASRVACRRTVCECGYDFHKCVVVDSNVTKIQKIVKRKLTNREAMATSRAIETPEQVSKRKICNRDAMVTLRANETPEQVSKRKMCNRDAMVTLRANETPEQVSKRKNVKS